MNQEHQSLEWKEKLSDSFLKTVSAYANYGDGDVVFGIRDDGAVLGLENPEAVALSIENKINDSLKPVPGYQIQKQKDGTVLLHVFAGEDTPYYYQNKAYIRNHTATLPVDRLELNRLILKGKRMAYEDLPASRQDLQFSMLQSALEAKLGLESFGLDTLRTLGLYTDKQGYNITAELLSDNNPYPSVDCVVFGEAGEINDRLSSGNRSLIALFQETMEMFRRYYCYETIEGMQRVKRERLPEVAFREALANAIVHRQWDSKAIIKVSMRADSIEISSPGGLPEGMYEEDYLRGNFSQLRNPKLAQVFFKLGYIEMFATGIKRIVSSYSNSIPKPKFSVQSNAIVVLLPLSDTAVFVDAESQKILAYLQTHSMSSTEIASVTGLNKSKVLRLLNKLLEQGLLQKTGSGKNTKYSG